MARHGENIRKRKDGRWEGRFSFYSEEKGRSLCHSVYGSTYEEVKEKMGVKKNLLRQPPAHKEEADYGRQDIRDASTLLFSEVAERWLLQVEETRKQSTYIKYNVTYRNYMAKPLGGLFLSDMTDKTVRKKLSDPLSDSMQKSVYCILNQILKFALKQYALSLPELARPVAHMRGKPVEGLTKTEQAKLLAVLYRDMDIFKMAVLLCLFTGLRLGELCALKWSDIDFANRIIYVNRTVQRLYAQGQPGKTVLLETEPKSVYSRREIPFSDLAADALLRFYDNEAYIFGKNKPMEPRTLQYRFKKMIEEAQISAKNFHMLRHTFATNCIEGGMDVKSLSEILGHAEVQITLNRYVHPSMDTKRRHMDELSGFYGQIRGQIQGQAC